MDLSTGVYDLAGCIVGGTRRRQLAARYTVRGYVQHRHGPEPPANGMACGHYVAYCRRGDTWFCADDASVSQCAAPPTTFPFLVFLEQVADDDAVDELPIRTVQDVRLRIRSKRNAKFVKLRPRILLTMPRVCLAV